MKLIDEHGEWDVDDAGLRTLLAEAYSALLVVRRVFAATSPEGKVILPLITDIERVFLKKEALRVRA